ncbi:MAG TPA: glutamate--tRNA ligase family protein, partial [Chthoniobacterales bacterium]|nr:glutamate--tRNA ligase family protein [Chthoniobacterales bacterium]
LTNAETHPDMTIRRPDGSWIFHFVNVVDDIEMKISHVIRGEDHLSNTPKHIELYRALGAEPPEFAHIPLILNKDGSKMSKRDLGASLNTYMEEGFLPEAVRNYIVLLGWSPKDDREKLPLEEIISLFELEKINRKPASFDLEKCTWLNGEYARELKGERFYDLARQALARAGIDTTQFDDGYVRAALDTCVGKFRIFAELPSYCGFYFREDFPYNSDGLTKHFTPENKPRLLALREAFANVSSFDAATLETTLKEIAAQLGIKAGPLVHPTRLAVTGSNAGPSLYHLFEILGKDKVLARIDRAFTLFAA